MNIIELISQPWHWSISGVMLVIVMFLLLYSGRKFGVSSTYRIMCAAGGSQSSYFNYDWKSQIWNVTFVVGAMIGGLIAITFLANPEPIQIAQASVDHLANLGITVPQTLDQGSSFVPKELFSLEGLMTPQGIILLVIGGFLIGFGARWAGGCTSGHAISGLSNLQIPSLIAVIGFFIGGLITTYLLLPIIMNL